MIWQTWRNHGAWRYSVNPLYRAYFIINRYCYQYEYIVITIDNKYYIYYLWLSPRSIHSSNLKITPTGLSQNYFKDSNHELRYIFYIKVYLNSWFKRIGKIILWHSLSFCYVTLRYKYCEIVKISICKSQWHSCLLANVDIWHCVIIKKPMNDEKIKLNLQVPTYFKILDKIELSTNVN